MSMTDHLREPDCSTFKQLFSVPSTGFLEGWLAPRVLAHCSSSCLCLRLLCLPLSATETEVGQITLFGHSNFIVVSDF